MRPFLMLEEPQVELEASGVFFHIPKNVWNAYIQLAVFFNPQQGWGYIAPDDSCTA